MSVIYALRVRISHAKCDFDTHESNNHTKKSDLDKHECD
jgi:hypothetical protein